MTQRMTAADFIKSIGKGLSQPKEGRIKGAERMIVDGKSFASRREGRRYSDLLMFQRGGYICDLRCQVPIELHGRDGPILTPTGRVMLYLADFQYFDITNDCWVVEDAKGHMAEVYVMKKAILAAMGVQIREV